MVPYESPVYQDTILLFSNSDEKWGTYSPLCGAEKCERRVQILYTRYPIVARALGLAAKVSCKGILHTSSSTNRTLICP